MICVITQTVIILLKLNPIYTRKVCLSYIIILLCEKDTYYRYSLLFVRGCMISIVLCQIWRIGI